MNKEKLEMLPHHLAIIPDGNRRWAKAKGMKPWEGHEAGAENTENLIRWTLGKGVACITFWGSSLDNLTRRPLAEKKALLDIYKRYFDKLLESEEIHQQEAKVNILGRWEEQFPESLKNTIYKLIDRTKNYKKKALNFMLAYSGEDDMLYAVQKIVDTYGKNVKITGKILKENLMTAQLPAVDYLIRTGGEPHFSSGFMMWDVANVQLFFSDEKYPDFNEEKLEEALAEFAKRQRRLGK